MRRYETTYILRPNLGEDLYAEIIERTNSIITNDGGAIINLQRWGTRKLAYEIKKEAMGYYVFFDYAAPGSSIKEMERIFRIDDRVLRFLTVKLAESIDEETIAKETERAAVAASAETAEEETPEEETVETDDESEEIDEDEDEDKDN